MQSKPPSPQSSSSHDINIFAEARTDMQKEVNPLAIIPFVDPKALSLESVPPDLEPLSPLVVSVCPV